MKRCVIGCILLCAVVIFLPINSCAHGSDKSEYEDANDLFELYNEALIEESAELEENYYKLTTQYNILANNIQQNEIYNKMRDEAVRWKEIKVNEISVEIDALMADNAEIKNSIESNLTGDWNTLRQLDQKYKKNCNDINSLLSEKSKYSVNASKIIDYDSLDELSAEIQETMTACQTAKDVKILGEVNNVKFPLAAETVITSKYGNRVDPMTGNSIRFHAGIDLRAKTGTPVLSLFNGVVTATGYGAASGYYVKVDHGNGIMTYYCHLSKITCEEGQIVKQYDQIALSGNTGSRTTGPHLHFGVYIDGNSVDPEVLFKHR